MSGRNLVGVALMAVGALLLMAAVASGCLTALLVGNPELPIVNPTGAALFDAGLGIAGVTLFVIGRRMARDER